MTNQLNKAPSVSDAETQQKITGLVHYFYKSCPWAIYRNSIEPIPNQYEFIAARNFLAGFGYDLKSAMTTIDGLWKHRKKLNLKRPIDSISILKLGWVISRVAAYISEEMDSDASQQA